MPLPASVSADSPAAAKAEELRAQQDLAEALSLTPVPVRLSSEPRMLSQAEGLLECLWRGGESYTRHQQPLVSTLQGNQNNLNDLTLY